jgi:hypothetical protein
MQTKAFLFDFPRRQNTSLQRRLALHMHGTDIYLGIRSPACVTQETQVPWAPGPGFVDRSLKFGSLRKLCPFFFHYDFKSLLNSHVEGKTIN